MPSVSHVTCSCSKTIRAASRRSWRGHGSTGLSASRRRVAMATSKRGNGEGSITRLADGRWQGRLTLDSGKRKAFYGKTRQEAASKLTAALRDRDRGLPVTAEKQTVAQYLAVWLETIKPSIRPKTWRRY